jgi:hypothetical protein
VLVEGLENSEGAPAQQREVKAQAAIATIDGLLHGAEQVK